MNQRLSVNVDREFTYTVNDFSRARDLLYQHAGIRLTDSKDSLVYSRLARRLRALGLTDFSDYLSRVSPDSEEWEHFLNALTTNLTSFFRENHHFEYLLSLISQHSSKEPFRIWCAASSTGEEPYSIAMTLVEAFGRYDPPASIIATDIDTNVLRIAREGIYRADRIEKMSDDRMRRFFLKGKGRQLGQVRVRPELQKLIDFRPLNLLSPDWPLSGHFDAIFCRNVLIYFDRPTQKSIVNRFPSLLKPDGYLFIGHSENLSHVTSDFVLKGRTIYQKVAS